MPVIQNTKYKVKTIHGEKSVLITMLTLLGNSAILYTSSLVLGEDHSDKDSHME
jgi:hypothetical protein